jgi:hypothetical protein
MAEQAGQPEINQNLLDELVQLRRDQAESATDLRP